MQPVSVSSAVAGDTLFCIYCEARKGVPTGDEEGLGVFFVWAALSLPLATVPFLCYSCRLVIRPLCEKMFEKI